MGLLFGFILIFSLNITQLNLYDSNGYTPLINSVTDRDYKKTEELLKSGADPNIGRDTKKVYYKVNNETGKTPLMYAATLGDLKMVKLLLRYRADPNRKNKKGFNALLFAVKKGYHNIVYFLYSKTKDKKSSLYIAQAVLTGDLELVKFFLKNGVSLKYVKNKDTLLTLAVKGGNLEIVRLILKKAPYYLNMPSKDGNYPVSVAIIKGNYEIFTELLKHDKIKLDIKNGFNQTLLHIAALRYGTDRMITELLNKGIDANVRDNNGKTALFYLINRKKVSYGAKILIEKTNLKLKDKSDKTVHFYAVDNYRIFKLLNLKEKVSATIKDKWGKSLMLYIIDRGDYRVLKMFEDEISKNRDFFNSQNLISVAVRRGNYDMVKILIEAGLDVNGVKGKMAPLLKAVELNRVYILYLLLFYKADKDVFWHGRTAWSMAEQFGYRRILFLLRDFNFER